MSETDNQDAGEVWCPGCGRTVPLSDPTLRLSFSPQAWTLHPDGSLDLGAPADAFIDYEHLECTATVRIVSNSTWVEELGDYSGLAEPMVEVTVDNEYQAAHELDFSASVLEEPEAWGPTYAATLEAYQAAREALRRKLDA